MSKKEKIKILHEDEQLVVVYKPARFLTLPDRFVAEKPNVYHFLQQKYGEIFVVHRLDKETSGILCFARTEEAHKDLCRQFEKRTVKKIYMTLVEGIVYPKTGGVIDKPIATSTRDRGRVVIAKRGKPSRTEYAVVEEFKHYTLIEAEIKTGRTHQIRVHFESIGHPLAVDALYGRKSAFYLSELKHKRYNSSKGEEEKPLMDRTTLHAFRLTIQHPKTGEDLSFESPLPKDFSAVLKQLRKWGN